MRLLVETILADEDEFESIKKLPPNKARERVEEIIKNMPNSRNLQKGMLSYTRILLDRGFNSNTNPTISFMERVPSDLDDSTVTLINELLKNKSLDVNEPWLYKKGMYEGESSADVNYRIKAFVYASNKSLQKGANRPITVQTLEDGRGKPRSAGEIRQILKRITIDTSETSLTLANAFSKHFPDFNLQNGRDMSAIKGWLRRDKEMALEDKLDRFSYNSLKNISDRELLNIPLLGKGLSKEDIVNALLDYYHVKKGESSKGVTGYEILQKRYKTGERRISKENLADYINGIYNGKLNVSKIYDALDDSDVVKQLRKILNSSIEPWLTEKPEDLLARDVKNVIDSYIGKGRTPLEDIPKDMVNDVVDGFISNLPNRQAILRLLQKHYVSGMDYDDIIDSISSDPAYLRRTGGR